jgi:hypothetical protein
MFFLLNRNDRSGSIILLMLYIYSFCYKHNIKYDGLFSDNAWWNNKLFFNNIFSYFGIQNSDNINKTNKKFIPFELLINLSTEEKQSSNLYSIFIVKEQCPYFTTNINYYFDESFKNFMLSKIKKKPFKSSNKILSVHIRRGDVNKANVTRYTHDNTYLKLIEFITKNNKNVDIHIFSEKQFNGNIKLYENNKTTIHLSNDKGFNNFDKIFDDILFMIYSDYLIMSKSGFSYVAGLLNKNIIYFNNKFWCGSLNNFFIYDDITGEIIIS